MTPNKQCMKDVLKFVSENAKVEVYDMPYYNIKTSTLNISMVLDNMAKEGTYTIEEIAYNFLQCYYSGFINVDLKCQQDMIQSSISDIIGITFAGINFLNQD